MAMSYAALAAKNTVTTVKEEKQVPKIKPTPAPRKVQSPKQEPEIDPALREPSICIPRVPTTFNDGQVIDLIKELGLGEVEKVDLINRTDKHGEDFLTAFVHFAKWNTDGDAVEVRETLNRNEKIKIVYNEPDYLFLSRSYTNRPGEPKKPRDKSWIVTDKDGFSTIKKAEPKPKRRRNTEQPKEQPKEPKSTENKRKVQNAFANLDLDLSDSE